MIVAPSSRHTAGVYIPPIAPPRGRPTGPGPTIVTPLRGDHNNSGAPAASLSSSRGVDFGTCSVSGKPDRRLRALGAVRGHDPHLAAAGALQIAFHLKLGDANQCKNPCSEGTWVCS